MIKRKFLNNNNINSTTKNNASILIYKNSLSTIVFIVVAILLLPNKSTAQESYINGRFSIKPAYKSILLLGDLTGMEERSHCLLLETNYGLSNFIETGIYLGYSRYKKAELRESVQNTNHPNRTFRTYRRPLLMYGVNANFHILPFLVKQDNFIIDLYLSTKVGSFWYLQYGQKTFPNEKTEYFDYGVYGGLSIHIGQSWGFFCEYGHGKFNKANFGMSFIFN